MWLCTGQLAGGVRGRPPGSVCKHVCACVADLKPRGFSRQRPGTLCRGQPASPILPPRCPGKAGFPSGVPRGCCGCGSRPSAPLQPHTHGKVKACGAVTMTTDRGGGGVGLQRPSTFHLPRGVAGPGSWRSHPCPASPSYPASGKSRDAEPVLTEGPRPCSIPCTLYGSRSPPGGIPEFRARSNPRSLPPSRRKLNKTAPITKRERCQDAGLREKKLGPAMEIRKRTRGTDHH